MFLLIDRINSCLFIRVTVLGFVCLLMTLSGCSKEELIYREVKRIDEQLTRDEIIRFLKIVQALPDQQLPSIPPLFASLPDWDASRTLSVSGLVNDEREAIRELWDEHLLGTRFRQDSRLMRVLNRFQITPEQFVGLTQTIGIAYNATTLREKQDLKHIVRKSRRILQPMEIDERTFASLSNDVQHQLSTQAAWITRKDRAKRLLSIPKENVKVARAMQETFSKIFPDGYGENAFDLIVDRLDKYGVPFAELPVSGYDDEITWTRSHKDARIGRAIRDNMIVNETQLSR